MPLPLYGSGFRSARTDGGKMADLLLVDPLDDDVLLVGNGDLQPSGIGTCNSLAKPTRSWSVLPCTAAR